MDIPHKNGFVLSIQKENTLEIIPEELIYTVYSDISTPSIEMKEFENLTLRIEVLTNQSVEILLDDIGDQSETLRISPGETLDIELSGRFSLPPGFYVIEIRNAQKKYFILIKVVPQNMRISQVEEMRKFIEEKLSGLSLDVFKLKRNGSANELVAENPEYRKYQLFADQGDRLVRICDSILRNPLSELMQEYGKRKVSRKPDLHSARWLCSAQGTAVSGDRFAPQLVWERKATPTTSNKENRWLVSVLQDIRFEIMNLARLMNHDIHFSLLKLNSREKDLQKERDRLDRLHDRPKFIYDKNCGSISREIQWRENEVNQMKRQIELLQFRLKQVQKWKRCITDLCGQFFLSLDSKITGTVSPSIKIFKDHRYRYIYNFHKRLVRMVLDFRLEKGDSKTPMFKPTQQLYEIYVYLQTVLALESLGFQWCKGWIKDNADRFVYDLKKDTVVQMENDQFRVCVTYNQLLPKLPSEDCYFYSDVNACPDVRIDFYDQKEGSYKGSFVVDAKYRRFIALYDDIIPTDSVHQANMYKRTIEYFNQSCSEPISAVSMVLFAYPRDPYCKEVVQRKDFDRIIYCQLSPDGQSTFGFEIFVDEIRKWMERKLKQS